MTLNLEAIKARCEKATAGPWYGYEERESSAEGHAVSTGPSNLFTIGISNQDANDADFIAHARTDLPALVAEVERLRKVESAARDMLNFGAHDGPCSHEEEGGKCLLHVVTSKTRERALRAALDAAQGGG